MVSEQSWASNQSSLLLTLNNESSSLPTSGDLISNPLASIMVTVFLTLIICVTVVGNALVIMAVLTEKVLRRVQYYLIMSLAMADEMVGLLVSPLAVYYNVNQRWEIGLHMCDLWIFLDVLACTASILHLVAIALDRYWSVVDITYIQRRTTGRILTMIAVVWSVALLISIPPFFGWKDPQFVERVNRYKVCLYSQDLVYQVFSTVSAFYAPLLLILLLYWRIYVVARHRMQMERKRKSYSVPVDSQYTWQSQPCIPEKSILKQEDNSSTSMLADGHNHKQPAHLVEHPPTQKRESTSKFRNVIMRAQTAILILSPKNSHVAQCQRSQSACLPVQLGQRDSISTSTTRILPKREARAARTLAIVTGSFILCWLPFFVLALYRPIVCTLDFSFEGHPSGGHSDPDPAYCNIPPLLENAFLWLGYINSALNPIIYTVFSPDFAKAFKRILSKAIFRSS